MSASSLSRSRQVNGTSPPRRSILHYSPLERHAWPIRSRPVDVDPAVASRYDSDLKRRVVSFLAVRQGPTLASLSVEAQAGVVTLRGRVATFQEKQLSLQLARRVAGVVRLIDDQIVIDPAARAVYAGCLCPGR